MKKALIVVDFQNDFCKGGSLEVSDAECVMSFVNDLIKSGNYDEIIFTQDFHPVGHCSFASTHGREVGEEILLNGFLQMMWPDHCVQGTSGADFHPKILSEKATHIVKKGTNPNVESYSAFFDRQKLMDTGLTAFLREKNIEIVEVVGLALDFCVKYTCLDAVNQGFVTKMYLKGTKAVRDEKNTISELIENGILIS